MAHLTVSNNIVRPNRSPKLEEVPAPLASAVINNNEQEIQFSNFSKRWRISPSTIHGLRHLEWGRRAENRRIHKKKLWQGRTRLRIVLCSRRVRWKRGEWKEAKTKLWQKGKHSISSTKNAYFHSLRNFFYSIPLPRPPARTHPGKQKIWIIALSPNVPN